MQQEDGTDVKFQCVNIFPIQDGPSPSCKYVFPVWVVICKQLCIYLSNFIPLWMPGGWLRWHFIKPQGLWNAWTTWNSLLNARTKQEILIKCKPAIFCHFYEMPRLYKLHRYTWLVYRNMRPYKMPKPLLTIPHIYKNNHLYKMPQPRAQNTQNGAHKKRMPDPIVSFFISFHRPKFHHTYSDFCQEETLIKCRDCMKTFPIMNLSGTNQQCFYKMVSLRNVGTLERMQN